MITRDYSGRKKGLRNSERKGEKNPCAKLTDAEVRQMRTYRADKAAGWTYPELALLFGISESRASEICRGLAYTDAGGPVEHTRRHR